MSSRCINGIKMNGIILFVCNSEFPFGSAYSSRVLHLCKLFSSEGYKPIVLADYSSSLNQLNTEEQSYEDIDYYIIGNTSIKYRYFEKTQITIKWISRIYKKYPDQKIIIVLGGRDGLKYEAIKRNYKSNPNIKLVLEVCEWYDASSYKFSYLDPRYLFFTKKMMFDYPRCPNIIAISSYLEKYFVNKGVKNVVRIPSLIDPICYHFSIDTYNADKITLMFAGSFTGNGKESFGELLHALSLFGDECPFIIKFFGATKQQFVAKSSDYASYKKVVDRVVEFMGYVPQQQINEEYTKADYSILFRPDRRSSNAGFPTKLAESMISGTPVILNNSSDIGLYIRDGHNGFLVDNKALNIKKCLDKIIGLTVAQRRDIRINAREAAKTFFSYKEYKDSIHTFFEKVVGE